MLVQSRSAVIREDSALLSTDGSGGSFSDNSCERGVASATLKSIRTRSSGTREVQSISFRGLNGAVGKRDLYTHHFHRYPAKLFQKIPATIFDALEVPRGSVVVDPFCGSGTVLVEAVRRGLTSIGFDTNPIAERISKAKTTSLSRDILESCLEKIISSAKRMRRLPTDQQLPPFWFSVDSRNSLFRTLAAVQRHVEDAPYRNFFEVTLSSIVRECSLADPDIPPPVKMRQERAEVAGPRYRRAFTRAMALDGTAVYDKFQQKAYRNIERLRGLGRTSCGIAQVYRRSALNTSLPSQVADMVVTSPPYCGGAQKYTRTFSLELMLLGYSRTEIAQIDKLDMGTERRSSEDLPSLPAIPPEQRQLVSKVAERNHTRWQQLVRYMSDLDRFARELRRILKPNGYAFVSLGTGHFAGVPIDFSACLLSLSEANGLDLVARFEDLIPSRGMITKRHQSAALIKSDDILWLRSRKK